MLLVLAVLAVLMLVLPLLPLTRLARLHYACNGHVTVLRQLLEHVPPEQVRHPAAAAIPAVSLCSLCRSCCSSARH